MQPRYTLQSFIEEYGGTEELPPRRWLEQAHTSTHPVDMAEQAALLEADTARRKREKEEKKEQDRKMINKSRPHSAATIQKRTLAAVAAAARRGGGR